MLAEKSKWGATAQGNLQTSKLCQSVLFEGAFPTIEWWSIDVDQLCIHLSRFEIDIMRSVGNKTYVYMHECLQIDSQFFFVEYDDLR